MPRQPIRPAIPRDARERIVARHPSGAKARSSYFVARKLVGEMLWEDGGTPSWGWGIRGGKKHGPSVEWWENGVVAFCEPYVDGMVHGVARHWDDRGKLLLRTRYVRGTGVDLWCDLHSRALAEETRLRAGVLHGVRRFWSQGAVWLEEHYADGQPHGVFREWNLEGRLRRGFPRYFVHGKRVDRRAYLRAAKRDTTVPAWRRADDRPRRPLPPEYVGQPVHRRR